MNRILLLLTAASVLSGCVVLPTVRQQDLDAWVGVPVEALDTHSLFITVPMYKSITQSGIEVRNYANGGSFENCYETGNVTGKGKKASYTGSTNCTTTNVVCNNIFYIKDEVVLEYAPTGRCYTDESVQPQARYLMLKKQ